MGDPSPDLKAVCEQLVAEGLAVRIGNMVQILPPQDEEGLLEMKKRENEAHSAYNKRFFQIQAEDAIEIRKARARIVVEDLRY